MPGKSGFSGAACDGKSAVMPRFFYAVFFAFLPWPAAILFCFSSSSSFSSLHRGCCPAWAAGRLPGAGHGVRGVSYPLSGCNAARALRKKRGFSLCLGADVCSRSRQSVSFFKGNTLPLHPRTPLFAVTRKESLELTVPRPPRVAWGVGANLPGFAG